MRVDELERRLRVSKRYNAWAWTCYRCPNWPGHIYDTWEEALMMGLDHNAVWHPIMDFDALLDSE